MGLNFKQVKFIEEKLKLVNKCFKELSKLTKRVRTAGKLYVKDFDEILEKYDLLSKKNELLNFAQSMKLIHSFKSPKTGNTYRYIEHHNDSFFDTNFYVKMIETLDESKDEINLENLKLVSPIQSFINIFKDELVSIEVLPKEKKNKDPKELLEDPEFEGLKESFEKSTKIAKEIYQLIIAPNDENSPKSIHKKVMERENEMYNSKNYEEISNILEEILKQAKDELINSYENGEIGEKLDEMYNLMVTYPEDLYSKTGNNDILYLSNEFKKSYDNFEKDVEKSINEEFKYLDKEIDIEVKYIYSKLGLSIPLKDSSLSEEEIKDKYIKNLPKGIICEQVLLKNDEESTKLICSCKLKEEKELGSLSNLLVSKLRKNSVFNNAIVDNLKYLSSGKGYVLYEFKVIIPTTLNDCAKLLKYSGISSEKVDLEGLECYKTYYSTENESGLKKAIERDLRDIRRVKEVVIDNIEITDLNDSKLLTFDLLKRE